MKDTYSAITIANAFLKLAQAGGGCITPMKIQKLVYLAHGYSLFFRDKPLIDELFEAWRFGPVLPSLYHVCKTYGSKPITRCLNDNKGSETETLDDPRISEIINFVWNSYGSMEALELSDWTHEKGGPWDNVIEEKGFMYKNQSIDNDLIKKYFADRMVEDSDEKT